MINTLYIYSPRHCTVFGAVLRWKALVDIGLHRSRATALAGFAGFGMWIFTCPVSVDFEFLESVCGLWIADLSGARCLGILNLERAVQPRISRITRMIRCCVALMRNTRQDFRESSQISSSLHPYMTPISDFGLRIVDLSGARCLGISKGFRGAIAREVHRLKTEG
jgi:hypothetical protein